MEGYTLTKEELQELRTAHRQTKNKKDADRIKAVYSLATGHSVAQVASILMVDEETLRNYKNLYKSGGVKKLLKRNHRGSDCRLNEIEIIELKQELQSSDNPVFY